MIINLYIDPGTGSLLIQALIAGTISTLVFFKNIKMFIFHFFQNIACKFKKKNE